MQNIFFNFSAVPQEFLFECEIAMAQENAEKGKLLFLSQNAILSQI